MAIHEMVYISDFIDEVGILRPESLSMELLCMMPWMSCVRITWG